MKKNKIILCCLLLIAVPVVRAQQLSVKPYLAYHHALVSQIEPGFHFIPAIPSSSPAIDDTRAYNNDFTLANGVECGLTTVYTFSNHLGVELGVGYFFNTNAAIEQSERYPLSSVDWDYHSIAIRPMFSYAVVNGKSTFTGKIGPAIHIASATMVVTLPPSGPIPVDGFSATPDYPRYKSTCTFGTRVNLGYAIGLEYSYQLSQRLSMAVELGFEQYRYTPDKATISNDNYFVGADHAISYVDEYAPPKSSLYGSGIEEGTTYHKLKESIWFSPISFAIAIKYNLWKK